jgi:hypothetical protein
LEVINVFPNWREDIETAGMIIRKATLFP